MHPEPDKQYREHKLTKVEQGEGGGWFMTMDDGWGFFCPADSPIEPKVGMTARMYGRGIGAAVRGLYLDGQKVYYFTETEYAEKQEIDSYGASPADWLERWDAGKTVWSIEMGGLGPGYEQCIHITAAEILRHLIAKGYDWRKWEDKDEWGRVRDEIEKEGFANPVVKELGLSGAQWGAAMNLAAMLYRNGPRAVMKDERVKDRKIQVNKRFPQAAAA
jgi:hypothetical protein